MGSINKNIINNADDYCSYHQFILISDQICSFSRENFDIPELNFTCPRAEVLGACAGHLRASAGHRPAASFHPASFAVCERPLAVSLGALQGVQSIFLG